MAAHWERIIPNVTTSLPCFRPLADIQNLSLPMAKVILISLQYWRWPQHYMSCWAGYTFWQLHLHSFKKGQQHVPWPCNLCRFGIADCQFRVSSKTHHSHHYMYLSASTIWLLKVWHYWSLLWSHKPVRANRSISFHSRVNTLWGSTEPFFHRHIEDFAAHSFIAAFHLVLRSVGHKHYITNR